MTVSPIFQTTLVECTLTSLFGLSCPCGPDVYLLWWLQVGVRDLAIKSVALKEVLNYKSFSLQEKSPAIGNASDHKPDHTVRRGESIVITVRPSVGVLLVSASPSGLLLCQRCNDRYTDPNRSFEGHTRLWFTFHNCSTISPCPFKVVSKTASSRHGLSVETVSHNIMWLPLLILASLWPFDTVCHSCLGFFTLLQSKKLPAQRHQISHSFNLHVSSRDVNTIELCTL